MHTRPELPITTEAFFTDPYPTLRLMREEHPVYFHPTLGVWFLTRYEHCEAAVRDTRLVNARTRELLEALMPPLRGTPELDEMIAQWSRLLWFLDPPRHTQVRAMVNRGFSAVALERVRPAVRSVVQAALAPVAEGGDIEIVRDFTDRIALEVISSLFGVPEADREELGQWIVDNLNVSGASATGEETARKSKEASKHLFAYLTDLVKERSSRPGDDMVSRFLGADAADPAVIEEVTYQCVQIIGAGYVTSRNQIANGVLSLLNNPDELARLRAKPTLLRPAIEEILRLEPSVLTTNRIAAEDIEFAGVRIPKGALVFPVIASANRDPAAFPDPDRLIIDRQGTRMLTFSLGPHYCIGGALVRMTMEESLSALLDFARWELAGPYDFRAANLQDRGPRRLPLRLSERRSAKG